MENKKPHIIFNYNNVFFSCFAPHDYACIDRCTDFGLNYVVSGEMLLDDGINPLHVTKGECVFVQRDMRVTMYKQPKDGEDYKGIFISFKRDFLRAMYEKLEINKMNSNTPKFEPGSMKLPMTPELSSLYTSMMPYLQGGIRPSDDIMALKMQEGLLALLHIDERFAPTMFDFSDPWKIDIMDFMNSHYMYELTTADMAHYTGRSLSSFKRDFKKISELTPEKWLMRKRLEKAHAMIMEGGNRVADIYAKVGFKNPSHFSTAFKRQYGVAPAVMMRQQAV